MKLTTLNETPTKELTTTDLNQPPFTVEFQDAADLNGQLLALTPAE